MLPFFRQYLFLTPVLVILLSEVTKLCIHRLKEGNWHDRLLLPGGFPSTHSAFVASMLIIVAHKIGVHSPEFAIAFCLCAITWYDSIFVRRQLGLQAELLNQLQRDVHLRSRLGHTATEVLGGIAFGAAITLVGISIA